jgi:hypothetical protein
MCPYCHLIYNFIFTAEDAEDAEENPSKMLVPVLLWPCRGFGFEFLCVLCVLRVLRVLRG